jgi:hypothetical protein
MFLETLSRLAKLRGHHHSQLDASQVDAVDGHGGVVGAKRRLPTRQRPLKLHPGTIKVPKILQHQAEVVPWKVPQDRLNTYRTPSR